MYAVRQSPAVSELPGWRGVFAPHRLTLGLLFPIEAYTGDRPSMQHQEVLARRAEQGGFAALWVRDVPLRVPEFGDLGQVYDPWVYLGWMAAHTERVALGTASIVLPLRQALHTAKAAASVDRLSGGRLLLGIASGDRPREYPAFSVPFERRQEDFREHLRVLRQVLAEEFPDIDSPFGRLWGVDLVPKPIGREIPVLVTGSSGQTLDWIAREAHGWLTYPRPLARQRTVIADWRSAVRDADPAAFKPFAQSLYIDLAADAGEAPRPIHLGWRLGRAALVELLEELQGSGANHVILNLKYGLRPAGEVVDELAEHVVPRFPAITQEAPGPLAGAGIAARGEG